MPDFLISWLSHTPGYSVPFALAALGLIISERAGVLSLTAEGFMLVGALSGVAAVLTLGGYPLLALPAAMLVTALVSVLFSTLVVLLRVNQVIAGLAMVFFCQGLTGLVGTLLRWTSRPITGLGPITLDQDVAVLLTIPIFLIVQYILTRTMLGLRLRAVGESPEAADSAGISVPLYRLGAVTAGAALMGLAGAYISVVSAKIWIANMTAGRGWIAVALVIFARWHPWRALLGAVLFGAIESLIPYVAAAGIKVPQYFMLMLPYVVTLGVMIFVAWSKQGSSDEPQALGQPYVREERR